MDTDGELMSSVLIEPSPVSSELAVSPFSSDFSEFDWVDPSEFEGFIADPAETVEEVKIVAQCDVRKRKKKTLPFDVKTWRINSKPAPRKVTVEEKLARKASPVAQDPFQPP